MTKYLPTRIMEDETQNSIQSLVKQLSMLISQQNDRANRYALTEGCLTFLRTNKKKIPKMKTLQSAKSRQKDKENKGNGSAPKHQKLILGKSHPISASKDKKKSSRCMSSKRKDLSKKSVQELVKLHSRQKTKSPEIFGEQKLKKKHIRMYSNQPAQFSAAVKQSRGTLGKTSCEHIHIDRPSKTKCTFAKKKTKFQN